MATGTREAGQRAGRDLMNLPSGKVASHASRKGTSKFAFLILHSPFPIPHSPLAPSPLVALATLPGGESGLIAPHLPQLSTLNSQQGTTGGFARTLLLQQV